MKRALAIALACLATLFLANSAHALSPAHHWSMGFGGTLIDFPGGVAVDANGNIYVTGYFQNTVNFGGGNLISAGIADIYLAKYDRNGAHLWSQRFGSTGSDVGQALALDGSGNVYVTGYFSLSASLGGATLNSAGQGDVFLAKYNPDGVHQWSQRFGSTSSDIGYAIGVDGSANVILGASFVGTVNFGGSNLISAGNSDIALARYTTNGVHQWSQRFGAGDPDGPNDLVVSSSGDIFMTGEFGLTVNFGTGNKTSNGQQDVFLAKYNSAGVAQWSANYGGTSGDTGNGVALDISNNVVLTGTFAVSINLGGGVLPSAGANDMFVAKYTSAGSHMWSRAAGGIGVDVGADVVVDAHGDCFLTGYFNNSVTIWPGMTVTSAGSADFSLTRIDASGFPVWITRGGGTASDTGDVIALTESGDVIAAGMFQSTATFGSTSLTSAGSSDILLTRWHGGFAEPTIATIQDIGNDQGRQVKIRFNGSGYDRPGSTTTSITSYEAYRRDDAPPSGSAPINPSSQSPRALLDAGWTQVGSVSAHGAESYGMDVPTIGDSTIALGPYHSTFFIRAATEEPFEFFDSPLDSGYSTDNLAPGAPQNFVYESGNLEWDESSAGDFDFFTVYGGNGNTFGNAVVVDYTTAPTLDVSASPYVFYFVTATDFSGNESVFAIVNTLSGAGETPKAYVLSVSNYPNPFNPRTTVRYTIPSRGRVVVGIYDVRGALVATLVDREHAAGAYHIDWDGLAAAGRSSGVYFARIEHNGASRSKKMVMLK